MSRRAERQLAARSLFVGAARAEYLPRVTLSARAGYAATAADSLFKRGTSRLLVGPVVSFPLFDVGPGVDIGLKRGGWNDRNGHES